MFSQMKAAAFNDHITKYPGVLQILKYPNLSPEERDIELLFAAQLEYDRPQYTNSYHENWGNELNTDNARELSEDYQRDFHTRMKFGRAVQEPAGSLIKKIWRDSLDEPSDRSTVVFLAGGGGSGKSFSLGTRPDLQGLRHIAKIVYDTTMSSLLSSRLKIDQAVEVGLKVDVYYVYCPIALAARGMLWRAVETGRVVPVDVLATDHYGAPRTFFDLIDIYETEPLVSFRMIVNDRAKPRLALLEERLDFEEVLSDHMSLSIGDLRSIITDEVINYDYRSRQDPSGSSIATAIFQALF